MKRVVFSVCVCMTAICAAFSQGSDHFDGGDFKKIIEYNTLGGAETYNVASKSILDKVLFGTTNSFVEYIYNPSSNNTIAFRIVKDAKRDCYTLEVFRLPDSDKVVKLLYRNTTETVLPDTMRAEGVFGFNVSQMVEERNKRISRANSNGQTYKRFSVEPISYRISEGFATKMHDKMAVLIRDFRATRPEKEDPQISIGVAGGDGVTFRCIEGDELWTLNIHLPQKRARQLASVCNQLIADAENDKKIDESKYVAMLDEILL